MRTTAVFALEWCTAASDRCSTATSTCWVRVASSVGYAIYRLLRSRRGTARSVTSLEQGFRYRVLGTVLSNRLECLVDVVVRL